MVVLFGDRPLVIQVYMGNEPDLQGYVPDCVVVPFVELLYVIALPYATLGFLI